MALSGSPPLQTHLPESSGHRSSPHTERPTPGAQFHFPPETEAREQMQRVAWRSESLDRLERYVQSPSEKEGVGPSEGLQAPEVSSSQSWPAG